MLIRLITVISLILFMLLMLSGAEINIALYRSIMAFLILFGVIYLAIFLLNVVKDEGESITLPGGSESKPQGEN